MSTEQLDVAAFTTPRGAAYDNPGRTDEVPERDLLGIPFAMLDISAVVRILANRPASAPFVYVATPNAQHLGLLHRGTDGFAFGLSRAWFLTCDSRVLRCIGRMLFSRALPVVTGSDLTVHLLRHVIRADDPVTIIGGSEELRGDLCEHDEDIVCALDLWFFPFF